MMVPLPHLLLFVLLLSSKLQIIFGSTEPLGLLLVYSNSSRYDSSQSMTAFETAVNSRCVSELLLPDYHLEIVSTFNSECNGSATIQRMLLQHNTFSLMPIVGIIGGGCSPASDILINLAEVMDVPLVALVNFLFFNDNLVHLDFCMVSSGHTRHLLLFCLPVVSYSPGLTGQSSNHYHIYPTDESFVASLILLMEKFGWGRLTVFSEVDSYFLHVESLLLKSLASINVTFFHIWPNVNMSNHKDLFAMSNSSRIFFINAYENTARKILCEAYNHKIYYPDYAWLLYGWYTENWLSVVHECSPTELAQSIRRGILIQQHQSSSNQSYIYRYAFDAVWSFAVALNETLEIMNSMDGVIDCDGQYCYLNNISAVSQCSLRCNLLKTNFNGLSGEVIFDSNRVRAISVVDLYQYRYENELSNAVLFGMINLTSGIVTYVDNETNNTIWPEGQPVDGSPIFVISPYSIVLKIFAYTWSSVGIVFAFACLIFNIVFRNKKLIRLTSPNLNYFIIFGAILLYSISFFTLIESDNDDFLLFSCITNVWAVSLGISFCFSPILAKMLRIYRIFRNPKANKKVLTDWHLFIIVVVIEGIVILLLVIGTAIPQVRPIVELSPDLERQVVVNESGFEIRYLGVNCYHIGSLVWVAIIAVFIGLLETIAVILATLTRQVEVKAVNDSKEVVAVVYIVTACSIALLVVTVALQSFSNVSDGFYLACILSGTTSAIGLMFIPKMWSLYKDPHGENVFEQPSIKSSGSVLQSQLHRQDSERIETLQREVGTLKKRLNSMRLASVQEVTETDCVTETEETDSNGINHHPGDDVFSPPETPSTDSNKTLAV